MDKVMRTDLPLVHPDLTIKMVMKVIDRCGLNIALVVDSEGGFLGTISDGDIRRAILSNVSLETDAGKILELKRNTIHSKSVTATVDCSNDEILELMRKNSIRQIPILDVGGRVVDLVCWEDLLPKKDLDVQAVVMAGGFGARLQPLTDKIPKPMLPVGDSPILKRILNGLHKARINKAVITTHYMKEKIHDYFGDGSGMGMQLQYLYEDQPLGTAGALKNLDKVDSTLLVMNGDILTDINFNAMWNFHRECGADFTIGVKQYHHNVPYGVIECDGPRVQNLVEKPQFTYYINAGIYLLEPFALSLIPEGVRFDMTDLVELLLKKNYKVFSFPIVEYWLDIGTKPDYETAQERFNKGNIE